MKTKPKAITRVGISNSERQTFSTCRRKWYWQYARRLSPMVSFTPFLVGTAFHSALEQFYLGKTVDAKDAVDAIFKPALDKGAGGFMSQDQLEELEKQQAMAEGMIGAYLEAYKDDLEKWEVLFVEKEASFPINRKWEMFFTIDMVIRDRSDGGVWVVEHKTAAQIGHDYVARLALDQQVTTYLVGVKRALGLTPTGVIYNVARKPQIRQKQNETRQQYLERVHGVFKEDPQGYLYRCKLIRSEDALEKFDADLQEYTREMEHAEKLKAYPMTTTACASRGMCPYFSLCVEGEDALDRFEVRESKSRYEEDSAE